jgi:heme exporter protein D
MGALEECALFLTACFGIFIGSGYGVTGHSLLGLLIIASCAAALAVLWPCLREHERGQRKPNSIQDAIHLSGRCRPRDRIHIQCFMLGMILWPAELRLTPTWAWLAALVTMVALAALGMVLAAPFPLRQDYPRPRHNLPWEETP